MTDEDKTAKALDRLQTALSDTLVKLTNLETREHTKPEDVNALNTKLDGLTTTLEELKNAANQRRPEKERDSDPFGIFEFIFGKDKDGEGDNEA